MAVPPDFVAGQVLTAAQMNAVGLWLVKTQTIGSGVSAVTVTDAFSADYENYRIIVKGGSASTAMNLVMTLGSTVTGYYAAFNGHTYAGVNNPANTANGASWFAGSGVSGGMGFVIDLLGPFATDETVFRTSDVIQATNGGIYTGGGYLNNTTSYTAFTLTTSTGTITGGTIYVYGYRD